MLNSYFKQCHMSEAMWCYKTLYFQQSLFLRLHSSFLCLVASRCGPFRFDHHAWAGERCRLHHTLHGLFCGRAAPQGRAHCGHVCLPCTFRPLAVGMHRRHCAARWHPGVLAQLAQPTTAPHGICVLNHTVQFHVVCIWLLRTAR